MEYTCPECGTELKRKLGKVVYYACPEWKLDNSGCAGHMYFESMDKWKIPSETSKGLMYNVEKSKDGRLFCSCPGGSINKKCKHREKVRKHYDLDRKIKTEGTMKDMFEKLQDKGLFKEYKSYEEWQKGKFKG